MSLESRLVAFPALMATCRSARREVEVPAQAKLERGHPRFDLGRTGLRRAHRRSGAHVVRGQADRDFAQACGADDSGEWGKAGNSLDPGVGGTKVPYQWLV